MRLLCYQPQAHAASPYHSQANGDRNLALYHLAVTTSLRQGELLGLKWGDIDWASGT